MAMNNIYLQYLKLRALILDARDIRSALFFGVMALIPLISSFITANHAVAALTGICSGTSFGIFLIKLHPVTDHLKVSN